MARLHLWDPNAAGTFIVGSTNFIDGTSFNAGDSLLVLAGHPTAMATSSTGLGALTAGTYLFSETGGANEGLTLNNISLGSTSSIEVYGSQRLVWIAANQFVNNGLVRVGSSNGSGNVLYSEVTTQTPGVQLTNNGTFEVQNSSTFQTTAPTSGSTLLNNTGGLVKVSNGSQLDWNAYYGANNASVVNNGSIVIQGTTGAVTSLAVGGNLTGSGVLSVQGSPAANSNYAVATVYGVLNAAVDLSYGNLDLYENPSGGSIDFLSGVAALVLHGGPGIDNSSYTPFGAVIAGFQQGDAIFVDETLAVDNYTYNTATHTLSLNSGTTPQAQFVFAGNYVQSDFKVALPYVVGYSTITTTSTANSVAAHVPPAVTPLTGDADPLFDAAYYLAANPDVLAAGVDPYSHYLAGGWREGRNPSAAFDGADYLAANPDVAAAHVNPLLHYEAAGQKEGRPAFAVPTTPPDPLVDAAYYYATNADVRAAGLDAAAHYDGGGWQDGRNPDAYFDTNFYLAQNPDVKAAGVDPLLHYELSGWHEGRDPSLLFSTSKYLAANPDVRAAGLDPLQHYLLNGRTEGRMAFLPGPTAPADPLVNAAYYDHQLGATLIPGGVAGQQQAAASYNATGWQHGLNPDALFDTTYYLAHNPDVARAHVNPLLHYETAGWHEGRDPSAQFSTNKYLAAYADVKAAGVDPLLHYVVAGQAEGRHAFSV